MAAQTVLVDAASSRMSPSRRTQFSKGDEVRISTWTLPSSRWLSVSFAFLITVSEISIHTECEEQHPSAHLRTDYRPNAQLS
jgi:hypothetical protein